MTCTCEYKNNTTTTNSNVCTPHSPTAICVDLWSNVYHAGGWNCSKSMHKSKWTYILVFSNLGNTSKRTNSKYGIRVQYYGHASSGQWTLTTPRKGIWTPVLKIQIHTCLFFNLYMCIYLNPRATSIPWSKFRIRIFTSYPYSITSTLQPLDLLKICSNDDFFVPTPSLWNWPLQGSGRSKTIVHNSGLKCPRHQGWYGISKFIGMHPTTMKGYGFWLIYPCEIPT